MQHYEPKNFGLLDWVHYSVLVLVYIGAWDIVYPFWASLHLGLIYVPAVITMIPVVALTDKLVHYIILPFLAKLLKQ